MKTVKIILQTLLISLLISSCTSDDNTNSSNDLSFISTSKSNINKIKSWSNSKHSSDERISNNLNSLLSSDYFDFDNSISYLGDNTKEIIVINPRSIDENVNYSITFNSEENTIYKNLLIKSTKIQNKLLVEYFNFEERLLFTTIFDFNNESISYQLPDISSNKHNRGDLYPCGNSVGENTVLCMEDVYSNHGWLSVWASVQTLILPQTGVAIAGACAVDAITSHNGGCEGPYEAI